MSKQNVGVVLVTTDAGLRDSVAAHLHQTDGYDLNLAANGQELFARLGRSKDPCRIVLLDERLPAVFESQVVTLTREVREGFPQAEVLIFTGDRETALDALGAGADRYLLKPIHLAELDLALDKMIQHNRLRCAAWENQQHAQVAERRARQLELLNDINAQLSSALDLNSVLQITLREGLAAVRSDTGSIMFIDPTADKLEVKTRLKAGQFVADSGRSRLAIGEGIAGYVAATGRAYNCPDIAIDSHSEERRNGTQSVLSVPIIAHEKVLGTINASSYEVDFFDSDDVRFLTALADQLAIAIEAQKLRDIGAILPTLALDELLDKIVENASMMLGAESSTLFLIDQEPGDPIRAAKYPPSRAGSPSPRQNGLTRLIANTGEPIVIPVARKDARVKQSTKARGVQSLMGVPLKVRASNQRQASDVRTIGALFVTFTQVRQFSTRDRELLQSLAGHAAIAIKNARLYEEAKNERDWSEWMASQLLALNWIAQMLQAELDLPRLLDLISMLAARLLGTDAAGILLLDRTRQYLTFEGGYRLSEDVLLGTCDQVGESIAGRVAKSGRPIIANNLPEDTRFYNPSASKEGWLAIISTPLWAGGEIIGTLDVHSKRERFPFTERDLQILSLVATPAAIAIQNARLFEQTQRRSRTLEALHQTSLEITRYRQVPQLMQAILERAGELLRAEGGALYMVDGDNHSFELVEASGGLRHLVGSKFKVADSVVGQVLRTQRPVCITDYQNWPDRLRDYDAYHFTAVVGAPITWQNRVWGAICIHDKVEGRAFHEEDVDLLTHFCSLAAVALENAELAASDAAKLRRLEKLSQANNRIMSELATMSLDDRLNLIAHHATEILEAEACSILLVKEAGYLTLEASCGHREGSFQKGRKFAIRSGPRSGLTGHIAFTGELFSAYGEQLINHFAVKNKTTTHVASGQCYSMLAIPLKKQVGTDEILIGLLRMDNKKDNAGQVGPSNGFSLEDEWILRLFADAVVVAIEGAELVTQLRDSVRQTRVARERLRSFYEASNALVSSRDPDRVLRDIVERACQAARAFGADLVMVSQASQARYLINVGTESRIEIDKLIRPNGLTMEIMRTGRIEVLEDTVKERGRVNPTVYGRGIAAGLGLPVSLEGRRIGVMWLHYDEPRSFSTAEIEALQLYVDQAALAYDSARRIKELEYLRRAAEALASVAQPPRALRQIVEQAREVLQADSASVSSYNAVRARFTLDSSVADGIPSGIWSRYCVSGVWCTRTDARVIKHSWIGIEDVAKRQPYGYLEQRYRRFLEEIGVQSFQGVVLSVGDEVFGILYVNYNRPRRFTPEERRTAQTFANHAALALKNANLLYQLGKARNAAHAVAEVTTLADIEETLNSVAARTKEAVGCDAVTVYVYDQPKDKLSYPPIMAGVHYPERASRRVIVPKDHIVFDILKRDQPYRVEDVSTDARFKDRRFARDEQISSFVAIPLKVGAHKVGVMFVNYRLRHHFTVDELTNIELFSNQAAIAIQNAHLYRRQKHRIRQMTTIAAIVRLINVSLDQAATLKTILNSIRGLIPYTAAEICLWDDTVEALVVRSQVGDPRYTERSNGFYRLDEGFTGWIAREHKPLLIEDVLEYEAVKPKTLNPDRPMRSYLGVPLVAGEDHFGTLELVSDTPGAFDHDDLQLINIISQHAITAIKNARLFEAEQRRAEYLAAIHQVSKAASSTLDSSEIFRRVLAEMLKVFELDRGSVSLFDQEGGFAYTLIEYPGADRLSGSNELAPLEENTAAAWVLTHRQPLPIENAAADTRLDSVRGVVTHCQIKSRLLVPLIVKGEVTGTINLDSVQTQRRFTKKEIELAQTIANQVATAIENAQLYDQVQRRVRLLKTLYEASRVLGNSLELEEILNSIAEQAWHLTIAQGRKAGFVRIILVDDTTIKLVAAYPRQGRFETLARLEIGRDVRVDAQLRQNLVWQAVKTGQAQLISQRQGTATARQRDPRVESELAIPIKLDQETIGLINVAHMDENAFDREDQYVLESLAAQAAIAIQNARLFKETQRHARLLDAAARVTRGTTRSLDEDELLDTAVHLIVNSFEFLYHAGVFLQDETGEYAVLRAASSPRGRQMLELGHKLRVGQGIVGYVVETGKPRLTSDVIADPRHYRNPLLPDTRAEVAFPLIASGHVIGALDVQSTEVVYLKDEDVAALQIMADQLANTIQNARQFEELRHTKGLVGARTALAWMGMVSAVWRHAIDGHAMTIREEVELLQHDIVENQLHKVDRRLDKVKRLSHLILEKPINPPLDEEEGVESVPINHLLQERLRQLWENEPYHSVRKELKFTISDTVTVRASPEWLRRVFDVLVDNAVAAMVGLPRSPLVLTVSTRITGANVEIEFTDKGRGMSPEIEAKLFHEPIEKPIGAKGLGMGVLMAQTIVQTYGGEIRLESTGPTGTRMVVSLPLEK